MIFVGDTVACSTILFSFLANCLKEVHLGEFLHVGRLDVDDVEGLVGDLHVPQVDAQVIGREISFLERKKMMKRERTVRRDIHTWSELTDIELMW